MKELFQFPDDWEIEGMYSVYEGGRHTIEAIISGDAFPEDPTNEDEPVKECMLLITKNQRLSYEVKET